MSLCVPRIIARRCAQQLTGSSRARQVDGSARRERRGQPPFGTNMPIARLIGASFVTACLAVAAPASSQADTVHSETGDYCVDEAQALLQRSFGPNARITKAQQLGSYGNSTLWVTTNLCSDYFTFSPLASWAGCAMPDYVSAPTSSLTMWSHGDCANLAAEGESPVTGSSTALSR
jgi:hypothetical protein